MSSADVQRMVTAAAMDAAERVKKQSTLSSDDVEKIIDKALESFCHKMGLPTTPAETEMFRKDISSMRASREIKEAIVQHGVRAVVTMFAGGLLTALWIGFQSMRIK